MITHVISSKSNYKRVWSQQLLLDLVCNELKKNLFFFYPILVICLVFITGTLDHVACE